MISSIVGLALYLRAVELFLNFKVFNSLILRSLLKLFSLLSNIPDRSDDYLFCNLMIFFFLVDFTDAWLGALSLAALLCSGFCSGLRAS